VYMPAWHTYGSKWFWSDALRNRRHYRLFSL
jgi:hypothetical protein